MKDEFLAASNDLPYQAQLGEAASLIAKWRRDGHDNFDNVSLRLNDILAPVDDEFRCTIIKAKFCFYAGKLTQAIEMLMPLLQQEDTSEEQRKKLGGLILACAARDNPIRQILEQSVAPNTFKGMMMRAAGYAKREGRRLDQNTVGLVQSRRLYESGGTPVNGLAARQLKR